MKNEIFKDKFLKNTPTKKKVRSKCEIKYMMQTESLENKLKPVKYRGSHQPNLGPLKNSNK